MTRFNYPVNFKRTQDSSGPSVSRCAGMPVGMGMHSDWHIQKLMFNASGTLPMNGINWAITVIDGGTAGAEVIALSDDLFPPHLVLTTNAADNDALQLQYTAADGPGNWINLARDFPVYFETMIRFTDAANDDDTVEQLDWFVGLCDTDTTLINTADDYIGFAKYGTTIDATQAINFVAADAGTGTLIANDFVQATGWTTLTPDTTNTVSSLAGTIARRNARVIGPMDWVKLAFLVEPSVNGTVGWGYAWVNDLVVGTGALSLVNAAGNAQVPNQNLCLSVAMRNDEGVAKTMHIAYLLLAARYTDDAGNIAASDA